MSDILRLTVRGVPFGGWEIPVKRALLEVDGVEGVTASCQAQLVGIVFDASRVTPDVIKKTIEALGYNVTTSR